MKTQILSLLCCLFAWLLPVQAQDSSDILKFSWKKVADRMPDEWYGSQQARASFDKGIGCILKTQIRVDGKPTVWCAQHDEHTFAPAPARAYELASFRGDEPASIVALLMSIPHPSPEIVAAVKGAVAWFETHAVKDIRVERVPVIPGTPMPRNASSTAMQSGFRAFDPNLPTRKCKSTQPDPLPLTTFASSKQKNKRKTYSNIYNQGSVITLGLYFYLVKSRLVRHLSFTFQKCG